MMTDSPVHPVNLNCCLACPVDLGGIFGSFRRSGLLRGVLRSSGVLEMSYIEVLYLPSLP